MTCINPLSRSLTSFQKDEVTAEYSEVYEVPAGSSGFNEFIGKYGQELFDMDRRNVVKLPLQSFSDLHEMKIAHRDVADHSLVDFTFQKKLLLFELLAWFTTSQPERLGYRKFYP